jgi:hypothetical protein
MKPPLVCNFRVLKARKSLRGGAKEFTRRVDNPATLAHVISVRCDTAREFAGSFTGLAVSKNWRLCATLAVVAQVREFTGRWAVQLCKPSRRRRGSQAQGFLWVVSLEQLLEATVAFSA